MNLLFYITMVQVRGLEPLKLRWKRSMIAISSHKHIYRTGTTGGIRTPDLLLNREPLLPLSYCSILLLGFLLVCLVSLSHFENRAKGFFRGQLRRINLSKDSNILCRLTLNNLCLVKENTEG